MATRTPSSSFTTASAAHVGGISSKSTVNTNAARGIHIPTVIPDLLTDRGYRE
jgi:hypothetical protein